MTEKTDEKRNSLIANILYIAISFCVPLLVSLIFGIVNWNRGLVYSINILGIAIAFSGGCELTIGWFDKETCMCIAGVVKFVLGSVLMLLLFYK